MFWTASISSRRLGSQNSQLLPAYLQTLYWTPSHHLQVLPLMQGLNQERGILHFLISKNNINVDKTILIKKYIHIYIYTYKYNRKIQSTGLSIQPLLQKIWTSWASLPSLTMLSSQRSRWAISDQHKVEYLQPNFSLWTNRCYNGNNMNFSIISSKNWI